jgi:hypothetical protein
MPKKTQRMVYAKGKSVFELIDPDGHVLQAYDAQFPIESLAKLGEQMKQLPKGWQCRTRALTEDLVAEQVSTQDGRCASDMPKALS